MDQIEAEVQAIQKADAIGNYRPGADIIAASEMGPNATPTYTKGSVRHYPTSPMDATPGQWEDMLIAAKSRIPYEFEVGNPGGAARLEDHGGFTDSISMKQIAEGVPGSLLPSVIRPELTVNLAYEPETLWSRFRGVGMDSQSVTWLEHVSNNSPAALTAELASNRSLGCN